MAQMNNRKTLEGGLSITYHRDHKDMSVITLRIEDADANAIIAEIKLSAEEFCKCALGNLHSLKCNVDVFDLDNIGKQHINETMEFPIPKEATAYGERNGQMLKDLADEACPDGWTPDYYFNSQNSFTRRDGQDYARCTIRTWVDKE